jgi:hypothetical protein
LTTCAPDAVAAIQEAVGLGLLHDDAAHRESLHGSGDGMPRLVAGKLGWNLVGRHKKLPLCPLQSQRRLELIETLQ